MANFSDPVTCPHCGTVTPAHECRAIEMVPRWWGNMDRETVQDPEPDTLYMHGGFEYADEGDGARLECPGRYGFMPLPEGLRIEWV